MDDLRPTEILFTAGQIHERVGEMAADIWRDTPDASSGASRPSQLHLIAVLQGAFLFASDLLRQLEGHASLDFVTLSSYPSGTTSSALVRLLKDFDGPIQGEDVVIVDDIVDTGGTLAFLQELLRERRPRSLRTACLLDKPARRQVHVPVDYIGFTVPDRFVVGYGLDYNNEYRNLPYIAALE
jgi:hypoxanthine phosphoribosyltransferase